MSKKTSQYLGDAVYVDYQRGMFVLTTENGGDEPSNEIFLEDVVLRQLIRYANRRGFPVRDALPDEPQN